MVSKLYKVGKKGIRVSKGGIVFRQIVGTKGATTGNKIMNLEKKHGSKNVEVVRKGNRNSYFVRTGQKVKLRR